MNVYKRYYVNLFKINWPRRRYCWAFVLDRCLKDSSNQNVATLRFAYFKFPSLVVKIFTKYTAKLDIPITLKSDF